MTVVILQGDAATKAGGPRDLVVGGAFEQIEFLIPFAYGFLENAGFPQLSYIWVFPVMIALWGIGGAIALRRYR